MLSAILFEYRPLICVLLLLVVEGSQKLGKCNISPLYFQLYESLFKDSLLKDPQRSFYHSLIHVYN